MSKPQIVAIKVKFTLNAKNGLRRVIFGLEKDTKGDEIQWVINFQLFERQKKTDEFGDALVDVDVEVEQALNKQADAAAKNGLTTGQAAHALGPGADDAKAAKDGEISEEEGNETIQATLKKK
jgi:hypothetical protein